MSLNESPVAIARQALAWRRENELFRFFEPNGPQESFIRTIGTGDHMVGILSAANGIGKTALVVNILGNLLWGSQSKFFDHPIFENWKFPKRARYITDPKLVEEIGPFHSEIAKWWPKGKFEAIKAGHNFYSQYKANDWVIDVMTYDQEIRQFEGGTLGLIIFDEPPPRDIWNASVARLRLGGLLLCFMTPLTHAAWFFDEVVPRHTGDIVYAAMEDNCKQHGVRGQLEHQRIKDMIAEMPQDEVEARAYGKALYLSGVIYKQFDPRVHVLKEVKPVPPNATIYQSVDPHSDKPFACIWAYPDTNGDLYIADEWPNEDFSKMHNCQLGIKDYGNIFRDKEQGMSVHQRVIDRHFADVRSAVNKRTLREELRDEVGLEYYPSYKAEEEIETGILAVRTMLQYDNTRAITSINRPKLYINPNCHNTIKAFQRWARDPKTGKVQETFKDFMDVVRYLVMENPTIDVPLPYNPPKKIWG